jgi:hypothetical protein
MNETLIFDAQQHIKKAQTAIEDISASLKRTPHDRAMYSQYFCNLADARNRLKAAAYLAELLMGEARDHMRPEQLEIGGQS